MAKRAAQETGRTGRQARLEAVRAAQRAQERRRTLAWVGLTAALVVVLIAAVVWAVITLRPARSSNASPAASPSGAAALTGVVTYPNLSRDHVQGKVTYPQVPPVGGQHSPVWENCGIYTSPVANENAVHSLEHGAIWVTYRPDLPVDQVKILRDDVRGQPYGLLSPYPGLPGPVVATVWGKQVRLASATDPRLKTFIATYADASQAPEPRGECTGGTGTPQG